MNKWNKLLAMLDAVFEFENKVRSNFKKIRQDFDDQTNEHVIVIEYRVQVKGTMNTTASKSQVNQQTMLQQLYAQAHANQNQNKKK
jgi:frataxin-like iron-binding protein CyaY